jgi:hypothetical protein
MENRTIVAVADGCGWGEKSKKAALLASRTFVEYVKLHQNEIVTLQDAGKLFLYVCVKTSILLLLALNEIRSFFSEG